MYTPLNGIQWEKTFVQFKISLKINSLKVYDVLYIRQSSFLFKRHSIKFFNSYSTYAILNFWLQYIYYTVQNVWESNFAFKHSYYACRNNFKDLQICYYSSRHLSQLIRIHWHLIYKHDCTRSPFTYVNLNNLKGYSESIAIPSMQLHCKSPHPIFRKWCGSGSKIHIIKPFPVSRLDS